MMNRGNKLMMKLLVASEAIFFLSLIVTYLYFQQATGGFAGQATHLLDIKKTGIFTVFLFCSSLTFMLAERNHKKGDHVNLIIWLIITIVFGVVFLAGQGSEYYHLIHQQLTLSKSSFGTVFYTLTGFHGLHVLIGLIILMFVLVLAFMGDFRDKQSNVISTVGLYWHFVDVVWLFVFSIVYVLPYLR